MEILPVLEKKLIGFLLYISLIMVVRTQNYGDGQEKNYRI